MNRKIHCYKTLDNVVTKFRLGEPVSVYRLTTGELVALIAEDNQEVLFTKIASENYPSQQILTLAYDLYQEPSVL